MYAINHKQGICRPRNAAHIPSANRPDALQRSASRLIQQQRQPPRAPIKNTWRTNTVHKSSTISAHPSRHAESTGIEQPGTPFAIHLAHRIAAPYGAAAIPQHNGRLGFRLVYSALSSASDWSESGQPHTRSHGGTKARENAQHMAARIPCTFCSTCLRPSCHYVRFSPACLPCYSCSHLAPARKHPSSRSAGRSTPAGCSGGRWPNKASSTSGQKSTASRLKSSRCRTTSPPSSNTPQATTPPAP